MSDGIIKAAGTTKSVSKVEELKPPMSRAPKPFLHSAPSDVAIATGIMPKIADSAVIKTGRSLSGQAVVIAS
jgi:hypothetical protein